MAVAVAALIFLSVAGAFYGLPNLRGINSPVQSTGDTGRVNEESSGVNAVGVGQGNLDKRLIGYYQAANVGEYSQYLITDIPADRLTHIIYESFNVSDDNECVLGQPWADTKHLYPGDDPTESFNGNLKQLAKLKEQYPKLKTIMSVGGWYGSYNLSQAAQTAESRREFAHSCIQMMQHYGFDGLEIQWKAQEHGGISIWEEVDRKNYALLLAELRSQLDALVTQDEHPYLLTTATALSVEGMKVLDWQQIAQHLDWVTPFAYDLNGSWIGFTGFHSALFQAADSPFTDDDFHDADAIVQAYLSAGVPSEKLVLGVPFFGRGWNGVNAADDGLYQVYINEEVGTWDDKRINYDDIKTHYLPTYTRHWDDKALVPWLFNPANNIMVSYEDSESLSYKANYVAEMNLGGIAVWELSRDDVESSLLNTIYKKLCDADC